MELNNFSSGLALIILLGLIIGAIVFCSRGIYEKANSTIRSVLLGMAFKKKWAEKKTLKEKWVSNSRDLRFRQWAGKRGADRNVTYMGGMRQVSLAFFYGSETILLVTIISGLLTSNYGTFWAGWIIILAIVVGFFTITYELSEFRYLKALERITEEFEDSRRYDYF